MPEKGVTILAEKSVACGFACTVGAYPGDRRVAGCSLQLSGNESSAETVAIAGGFLGIENTSGQLIGHWDCEASGSGRLRNPSHGPPVIALILAFVCRVCCVTNGAACRLVDVYIFLLFQTGTLGENGLNLLLVIPLLSSSPAPLSLVRVDLKPGNRIDQTKQTHCMDPVIANASRNSTYKVEPKPEDRALHAGPRKWVKKWYKTNYPATEASSRLGRFDNSWEQRSQVFQTSFKEITEACRKVFDAYYMRMFHVLDPNPFMEETRLRSNESGGNCRYYYRLSRHLTEEDFRRSQISILNQPAAIFGLGQGAAGISVR
ncbi:uncharacterized protein BDR25DRAFT_358314 [Lindgomyces ingoldianus]|uniref:Uncharacterized protein n=1 Tax=Lindgomyces ingoldianus TaxID=673940 RepID=A0ACB6QL12_9PLEO|nr:uncharacterized protein BDR25DRAFT_358314 [Lindgomyces ingoldianus]KAF2467628.1 hypothetical protein BDR25DRAFT_358314 [Lindgomyces ingoldianus]